MDSKYNITSRDSPQFRNTFTTTGNAFAKTPTDEDTILLKRKSSNGASTSSNNGGNSENGAAKKFKLDLNSSQVGGGSWKQTSILEQRRKLPVFDIKDRLMKEIEGRHTLIIMGETGSGKTTQIPQYLYESEMADDGMIGITQPRRVAAISISRRVATEMNCKLGEKVGYKVRFEDSTSTETKIKFMTDGTLLREALRDKLLKQYRVIILDEAHERTINTDILFGIVKEAQRARRQSYSNLPPLKIIIMSATMDVDHFSKYFNYCNVLYLEGRTYKIRFMHVKQSQSDYMNTCLQTIFDLHKTAADNHDFLVFLTGQDEIEAMATTIRQIANSGNLEGPKIRVLPLYAALPYKKQMEVFNGPTPNSRKIILSTNIAETSITIPGIKYVIDSGMVKMRSHDPITGIDTLKVCRISQAQALQRAGRAGRDSDGFCYRTYTMKEYELLPKVTVPEISRCNLASVALQLLNMEIDYQNFDFIDVPPQEGVRSAVRQLQRLGAINHNDSSKPVLTDLGKKMCKFPLDPIYSRIILAASGFHCLEEMLNIIAVLSTENIFLFPSDKRDLARERYAMFQDRQGDHITLLRVFRAYLQTENPNTFCRENYLNGRHLQFAKQVKQQLIEICQRLGMPSSTCGSDTDPVRKCLIFGLSHHLAELQSDNHYITILNRQRVKIHPSSVFCDKEKPKFIIFSELIATGRTYVRTVTSIESEWIHELVPNLTKSQGLNGNNIRINGFGTPSSSSLLYRF